MSNGMVVVTTDCGAGSSGKGSLNAWLATKYNFHLATNNWATNAGHFVEWESDSNSGYLPTQYSIGDSSKHLARIVTNHYRVLNQHICSAFINPNTILYINPGASIDVKILLEEIRTIESIGFDIKSRLFIHPNTNVITNEDKEQEKAIIKSGSTFKGCGAALARKTLRIPGQKLAKDYDELAPFIKDMTYELNEMVAKDARILIEGSQGIDLDINFSEWPYCTSRQTHPTQLIADAGLSAFAVTSIIGNIRTNPIRINNQSAANENETCYTGNYWDAKEIGWEEVAKRAGYDNFEDFKKEYGFALMTSVTKKLRRVFEFPRKRMAFVHALMGGLSPYNRILYSLNFVNFIDKDVRGATTLEDIMTPKVVKWLRENLYPIIGYDSLGWIRTGPEHNEIIELRGL